MLTNGQVLVAGGEYGTGTTNSEVYDPVGNTWTIVPIPAVFDHDEQMCPSQSGENSRIHGLHLERFLPNGNVLAAPVVTRELPASTMIYNTAQSKLRGLPGPRLYRGIFQDEASWVKLPDDSIVTIDPVTGTDSRALHSVAEPVGE